MVVSKAFIRVFREGKYRVLALVVSLLGFAFATWLPNLGLVFRNILWGESLRERVELPFLLLGSIATNFTLFSASTTLLTVSLLGVSAAMIIFSLRMQTTKIQPKGLTSGIFGTVSGALGIGCAACGSIVLTPVVVAFGGVTFLAALPLRGGEFALIGIGLLIISIVMTAQQIEAPKACKLR
jgi:hypothetical protein